MRFNANSGSHVDIDTVGVNGLIVSTTEAHGGDGDPDVAMVVLDANHGEALAHGILAAVRELNARAVG